jgi:prepilin-type processing-associated H-X9-DG protein
MLLKKRRCLTVPVFFASCSAVLNLMGCERDCTNQREVYSFHPGGANAARADGSVHFLRAGMSTRFLAALVTRAGDWFFRA